MQPHQPVAIDVLPEDGDRLELFHLSKAILEPAGYGYVETPAFEDPELFARGVGEATDIVQKEMYVFEDRGGQELALRPEGTAPICRAYLEHGMHNQPQPVRLYYVAPNFRYDRPQAGRYRQHHQFGAEAIGEADASVDAEIVELLKRFVGNSHFPSLATVTDEHLHAGHVPQHLLQGHRVCIFLRFRL